MCEQITGAGSVRACSSTCWQCYRQSGCFTWITSAVPRPTCTTNRRLTTNTALVLLALTPPSASVATAAYLLSSVILFT